MANSKTTKKALLSSALALTMCVAMLIATTFAWFTDTASTSVNKIQAGKLDVQLLYKDADDAWQNAEGKTLGWMQKTTASGEAKMVTTDGNPLWEPGCTFTLPELKIVNNGDLELKYEIGITGIDGDAKLDEVIDWTMKLKNAEGTEENLKAVHRLAAKPASGESASIFTISGHMDEKAGNEYQGLSIDGISITVYATQVDGEYDSNGNSYDANVDYNYKSATIMGENGETTTLESGKTYTFGTAIVNVDGQNITYTNNGENAEAQAVTITTEGGDLTVDAPKDTIYHYGEASNVNIKAINSNSFHEFGKVDILEIAKGRVVVENGNNIAVLQVKPADTGTVPIVAVPQSVVLETELQVESGKGVEVAVIDNGGEKIETESFKIEKSGDKVENDIPAELEKVLSKDGGGAVTLEEPKNYKAMIGTTPYETFAEAVNAVKAGETIKLVDDAEVGSTYSVNNRLYVTVNNVTIDLNNKTLSDPNYTLAISGENVTVKNGNVSAVNGGSYAIVANGKNVTIDRVTTTGGISVSGYNGEDVKEGISAVIKNCNITGTGYYAVCAQGNADASIENSTLTCGTGAFFWIESSKSSITYDSKTVKLNGNKRLYNDDNAAYGAPVVKNLTVKDAEGNEKTVDAVAVSTAERLAAAVSADFTDSDTKVTTKESGIDTVVLTKDIALTEPLEIHKTMTIIGNGHTLATSSGNRVVNCNDNKKSVVLTLDGVKVEASELERGISVYGNENVTLVLDNCEVTADHYAINIADDNNDPKIIVRNSVITGYSAFQTHSNIKNAIAYFENSRLIGLNQWNGSSDDFAAIVVNTTVKPSKLSFKNCTIEAREEGKTEEGKTPADEKLLDVRGESSTVTFEGCKFFLNGKALTGDAIKSEMETQKDTTLTIK